MSSSSPKNEDVNKIFRYISNHIGKDVRKLGSEFNFTVGQIESFTIDHSAYGNEEVAYQILTKWRQSLSCKNLEILKKLKEILIEIGHKDLTLQLDKYLSNS